MSETPASGSTSSGTSDTTAATPDAATTTADTPGPADSPGEPSNPPDGTPTESGAVASRGTDPEPSGDEKIDAAYDPSKPPYTGDGKAKQQEKDVPEVSVKAGNATKQQPPN